MTETEAYEYINGIGKRGSVPGLESISSMLNKIGDPQEAFKVIHVTGTNGKGSFCAMMAAVLMEKGYKVGVFSSPHLIDIRETVTIDSQMINKSDLVRLTSRLAPVSEALDNPLTQFEFMTALCFEHFKEKKVDIAVVEVGMGGRLDATNVFSAPLLSVITGISADHTSWLGGTLEDIAKEKSGIIKKGCPVYFGGSMGNARNIIKEKSEKLSCSYYEKGANSPSILSASFDKTEFEYKNIKYTLSLPGNFQADNAAKVIDCCNILNQNGFDIKKEHICRGLNKVKRRARFEVLSASPAVIYDGGHNPECAAALAKSIKTYFGNEKVDVIMGVLADKDYDEMTDIISEIAKTVYTITVDNPRALDGQALAETFCKKGITAYSCQNYQSALEMWQKMGQNTLIVTGSLYSYKDFISEFNKLAFLGINE